MFRLPEICLPRISRDLFRVVVLLISSWAMLLAGPLNAASSNAVTQVPHLVLIQNSGWMLPFYDDPDSRMKELITELSSRLQSRVGGPQAIISFNQSLGKNHSPLLHYQGEDANLLRNAIQSLQPARKPGKKIYTDTDFKEALIGAITQFSPGKSCLLWIITNNKNSPDNSKETAQKNKEFYQFLQESAEIRRIVAFPLAMPVKSSSQPNFTANGLMIYAMAYGDLADKLLQGMLAQNLPFGKQPARLKPLNAEALTFVPGGVRGNGQVTAQLSGKTLVLNADASSQQTSIEIVGQFRNDFYPYDIRSASIGLSSGLPGGQTGFDVQLSTNAITGIPAGDLSPEVRVKISLPPTPSIWSPEVLFGSGYQQQGSLSFELQNQKLEISPVFVKSMSEIFPNDPLPDLFVPGDQAQRSVTLQPLLIKVTYPAWPLIVVFLALLLALGLIIGLLLMLRRERMCRVSVDGQQKPYTLRPFREVVIKNSQGERIGVLKRAFGKPFVKLDPGKQGQVRVL